MFKRRRLSTHMSLFRLGRVLGMVLGLLPFCVNAANPTDPPAAAVLAQAKQIVQGMIDNPRGPYSRILWYCNDGSEQPPVAFACREHGGGHQYAAYSPERDRLAELGWSVGTIYTPLTFETLRTAAPRSQRLRELPLEAYLVDIDDGWVLRQAQNYRGRVQIEDEIYAGREILGAALADNAWLSENYLLARELVRVIPHGEETDLSRQVRRAAIELAERDPAAERWRVQIHSAPNAAIAGRLRRWAAGVADPETVKLALALADNLDLLYGSSGRREQLERQLKQLRGPAATAWRDDMVRALEAEPQQKVSELCAASDRARRNMTSVPARDRLAIMDVLGGLEIEVQLAFPALLANSERKRAALLNNSFELTRCVYGAGLISATELASLQDALSGSAASRIALNDYRRAITALQRVPGWAAGTVRYTFAEALSYAGALDSRALRFADDLLRGSPLWLLGDLLKMLTQDVAELSGSEVNFAGQRISSAIALNPGFARGTLRIFESLEAVETAATAPGDILVLPETIAELKPVAGILTLGEGNALSHVQLLARNFGIPNVAIDYQTIDLLKSLEGQEVVLIVSSDGNAILQAATEAGAIIDTLAANPGIPAIAQITMPLPDLTMRRILPLAEIHRQLSGQVIGPKAANLGELNRLFPGRVAPALAIPFGIYAAQLEAQGLRQRIVAAYAAHASGQLDDMALNAELAEVRTAIAGLVLSDETQRALKEAMQLEFGETDSYGLFVRSDTNVEDLPQFTGAGLSETIPNVVGLDSQLSAVPRVWASVLSPRALAWRSSLLTNPEQIYASVLLMKSVPSAKSGVLVTANLTSPGAPGLTVSTAWGVGGAVAGEAAESLVLLPDDKTSLISEAKTPYQRRLAATGGVEWEPAPAGRILNDSDIAQLRVLAAEVNERYAPVFDETGRARPWDIEFGFVDGELTLFQIRPLVEKNVQRVDLTMQMLRPAPQSSAEESALVDLLAPIAGTAGTAP